MEFDQIITLIKTVSDSKITSFSYEKEDFSIKIKAGDDETKQSVNIVPAMPQMSVMQPLQDSASVPAKGEMPDNDVKIVTSPLVGTFYSSASPDELSFVSVGDYVKKGQKLGIIEAMKLMNDIESDFDGEIVEIMVSNENMVEYGQPLFKIK